MTGEEYMAECDRIDDCRRSVREAQDYAEGIGSGALDGVLERAIDLIDEEAFEVATQRMLSLLDESKWHLVDDGSLDTVIGCDVCGHWERFDGREAAIMFLEDGEECDECGGSIAAALPF